MRNRLFLYVLLNLVLLVPALGGAHLATSRVASKKSLPLGAHTALQMKTPLTSRYLPDRIVVKLQTPGIARKGSREFGVLGVDAFVKKYGVLSIDQLFPFSKTPRKPGEVDLTSCYVMRFASPLDAFRVAEEISQLPEVVYAEPLFLYRVDDVTSCTPNDSSRGLQWYLDRILADTAFCISTGDTSVVIGIVDTGVQLDHPDLAANIWHNSGEMGLDSLGRDKRFNGIDDDGDGYVDDWQGWDFGGADFNNPIGDNDPSPKSTLNGHGTHVAGVASAVTNNSRGISGIGYNCRIMAIKTTSDNDTRPDGPYIVFGFDGIVFAADHGAKIINCSWGGAGASQFEQDVINYATQEGSLVVAAAGNGASSEPNYPSSYDNVLSVAATSLNDKKSTYSNYGSTIDVSAPGGEAVNSPTISIYSTDYPSTYGIEAGTSFSSPLTAGLAALVATKFPGYSPVQIGEQVRVTADSIDAPNPFYIKQLGKGRINALRALTESWPSVRLVSFTTSDSLYGNNDGSLEANEEFTLSATLLNYLAPTSGAAMVTLTSTDTNVQILSGQFAVGAIGTMQSANNSTSPFLVKVAAHPAQGALAKFMLLVDDGNYHDFQAFSILVNPTFGTHDANNVHVTLTNIGGIGFNDFPNNTQGVGFSFGGLNQLFEGGVLMGYSATNIVDNVRNDNNLEDADFASSQIFSLRSPGTVSNQDGGTSFSDSGAASANRIGLQVALHSYEFTSPADSNYMILRLDIKNISGASFANFYAGLFLDWDIQPDYSRNMTTFDPTYDLGYAWNTSVSNSVYCGVRALDGTASYRGLINNLDIDLSRSGKWSWISGGVVTVDSVEDIHFAMSSGPYTIQNGGIQTVGFALLGGTNLTNLEASSNAAAAQWDYIKNGNGRPQTVELIQPLKGQNVLEDTVTLQWSSAVGAVKYQVEVAPDTSFSQLMFNDTLTTLQTSHIFPNIDSTYFWRVIAFNGTGQTSISEAREFSVGTPLHINIPILQNPVLSPYADLIVTTTVPFLSTPTMTVSVGSGPADTIPLSTIAPQVYKGSIQFTASGNVDVRIYAKRLSGTDVTGERQFAVGLLKRGIGGSVTSTDRNAVVSAPAEALGEDTYFTVLRDYTPTSRTVNIGDPYIFGPARTFSRPLVVNLRFLPDAVSPGKERFLHIYRSSGNGWQPVETWIDTRNHMLTSSVTTLGTFSVGYDEHFSSKLMPTSYRLYQNYPNPFNPQTKIDFDLPEAGTVHLTVFNVLGQEVIRLLDGDRTFGNFETVWNGKNAAGNEVSSGVYFYRLEVMNGPNVKYTSTQKMVLVR